MEDPALAKGLVERDVIRLVTPGTLIESSMLDDASNNFLGAAYRTGDSVTLCFADISTGEVSMHTLEGKQLEGGSACSEAGSSQIPRSLPAAQRLRCTAAPPGYTGTEG